MWNTKITLFCFIFSIFWTFEEALDNGLALTPPMGWMSWERFMCNTNCKDYPQDCISENLIKTTADAMVKFGFKAAGYEYVSIDDCWMAKQRDSKGNVQPDPKRFPSGIKALADYIHGKGLKLGIYLDTGNLTCAGYPGSAGHYQQDAKKIASWGVDMLKLDGCNTPGRVQAYRDAYTQMGMYLNKTAYTQMGMYLNKTGRPILYGCSWPLFVRALGPQPDFAAIDKTCNHFRVYRDIGDSWLSLKDNLKYFGEQSKQLANFSGPGHWVDPDQLVIGNFGLSPDQQKMQMAIWSIMSAPMFVSADIRNMDPGSRAILLNKMAIQINQDKLGLMGSQIAVIGQVRIWKKDISPKGSFALAMLYENISGGPSRVTIKLQDLHLPEEAAWNFTDVFSGTFMGTYKPWYTLNTEVNPTGVKFIHALRLE